MKGMAERISFRRPPVSIEQARDRLLFRGAGDGFAEQRRDRQNADVVGGLTGLLGRIESVITSSLRREFMMRATAPPDSTPWVK